MGHYRPTAASYANLHKPVDLDRESSPCQNNFEFTFTVESKIHLYQPLKHEVGHLQAPKIGWRHDPENSCELAPPNERPSSPIPWAFGDDDDASTQGVDPLLLQLEDESSTMIYFDDDDDNSLRDPFESQPLVLQPHNSDASIESSQGMLDEEEEERRENERHDRKRALLGYVMGSPRRARHFSEERIQTKGVNVSLRRKVLLRNAMMDECVRRDGSPLALTQTLRNTSSEAGWDDNDEGHVEK